MNKPELVERLSKNEMAERNALHELAAFCKGAVLTLRDHGANASADEMARILHLIDSFHADSVAAIVATGPAAALEMLRWIQTKQAEQS